MNKNFRFIIITIILLIFVILDSYFDFNMIAVKGEKIDIISNIQEREISKLIEEQGVFNVLKSVHEEFRKNNLNAYECHSLLHILGHLTDMEKLEKEDVYTPGLDICAGGFRHGMEAKVAIDSLKDGSDFRLKLYHLCELLLNLSISDECYHGTGHEIFRITMNFNESFSLCDSLIEVRGDENLNCYRGIFSEYTNFLENIDSETGYQIQGDSIFKLNTTPIDFCSSLNKSYQWACTYEVSIFGLNKNPSFQDFERILNYCIRGNHSIELKSACVQTVSSTYYAHTLAIDSTVNPPKYVLSWPDDLKISYIDGAGSRIRDIIRSGQDKDWQTFCFHFNQSDRDRCFKIFE